MNHTKIRKTLGQSLKALVSAALFLSASVAPASRAYADDGPQTMYKVAAQLAIGGLVQGGVASTNNGSAVSTTSVVGNLSYGVGPATAAYITVVAAGSNSSNCIVFYAPYNVIDTSIGSATCGYTGGAFDLGASTMNTIGALSDAINTGGLYNGLPRYHFTPVGAVRSDSSSNYFPVVTQASGVNNLSAVGGYNVAFSTTQVMSLGIIPGQNRHVILNYCSVNSAGTPQVQVFGVPAKFGSGMSTFGATVNDSYPYWLSPALTANTLTFEPTAGTTYPSSPLWLEFAGASGNQFGPKNPPTGNAYNGHVVVRVNVYGANTANEASTNFINCEWFEK